MAAEQVEKAVELAFDPRTDQSVKAQAYDFLNQFRQDPGAWHISLSLFTREPLASEVVRLVSLEVINNAIQGRTLSQEDLVRAKEVLLEYISRQYIDRSTRLDSPGIQNKLTQTITYLFMLLYSTSWTTFFDDFRALCGSEQELGQTRPDATMLYLRVISSVHDEIADVLIPRTNDEQRLCTELKDLVRARDMRKIALTWQGLLSRWRQIDLTVIELCLRTIAKWVSWIDIWLVVGSDIQNALLELAGQEGDFSSESKTAQVRDAAIDTYTETVAKKMQPADKIELIRGLNLQTIVGQLLSCRALSELKDTPDYDTDLGETVAKLVNNVVFDIVKVLDTDETPSEVRDKAVELINIFMPHLLRMFSDEYDEICSTVIPALTDLITMFRRVVKTSGTLPPQYSHMVQPILDSIVIKMRYDDTASWGDEDDHTTEAEFQELRKRLYILQQTIATVDEALYIDTISSVVAKNLASRETSNWRDLDLALHEMYLFGELAVKNGGIYTKSTPSSAASQRLLEMVDTMIQSNIGMHSHPAIQLQFMEICVRYVQYFEHNPAAIPATLQNFVRLAHTTHLKVRLRAWYLFHRFVKHLRAQLGNVAQDVVAAIGDLLVIKAELPTDRDEGDISSDDNDQSADAASSSQLFLFESVGCIASTSAVPIATKMSVASAVIAPLAADLKLNLGAAKNGDARALLQIHHITMAFGSLANGYSDWTPGSKAGSPPEAEISDSFVEASDVVLGALRDLSASSEVRAAARHAFSRFMGVLGARILPQLPQWIDGLLSSASSNDEMAMFLRLLGQVVYGFKTEIMDVLDQLLSPMMQKVYVGLASTVSGTDDEIQLKELKSQYLTFLLVILNNDLGGVLVSSTNQATFETLINTIMHFSQDAADPASARLALSVLTNMTNLWGGESVEPSSTTPATPMLPGFDNFILASFASLPWRLITASTFNAKDAQVRSVLQEAAGLQWTILRKAGLKYREQLSAELTGLGVPEAKQQDYMKSIDGDLHAFRKFFATFVQSAR